MKALAIDSSNNCICFAARNDLKFAKLTLDIGMHQSEQLLPSIEHILKLVDLPAAELEFTALCSGPGSFTGLRLAYAALKAIELAHNVPVYGINTLAAYAMPFAGFKGAVVPVIDAKKNRFYAVVYRNGKLNTEPVDAGLEEIVKFLDKEENVLAVGQDADYFAECLRGQYPEISITTISPVKLDATEMLLEAANEMFLKKEEPLKEYDGPVYIRPSEAEEKLKK